MSLVYVSLFSHSLIVVKVATKILAQVEMIYCYLNGNAIINKLCGIVYAYETLRKCFNIVYIAIYIELFQSSLKPGAGPTAGDTTNGK